MDNNITKIMELADAAKKAKEDAENAKKAERKEKVISAVSRRAVERADGWLENYTSTLKTDVEDFLKTGCDDQLLDGISVYFGSTGSQVVKYEDFGHYILSLEPGLTGAHYPWVLKIKAVAQRKLALLLKNKLKIEDINMKGVNEILCTCYSNELGISFLTINEFLKELGEECEPITLATEIQIIGKETPIEVQSLAYVSGETIFVTKTSWWDDNDLPQEPFAMFHLRYKVTE